MTVDIWKMFVQHLKDHHVAGEKTGLLAFSCLEMYQLNYRNDPVFLDRQVWANRVDPDQLLLEEQSDQGVHCLPFRPHLLDTLLYGKTT